ncbi:hypothetical protein NPX13_g361 [Xylaria arbuscula]|uniref:DUF1857-domain-containing protein n=1 Tax=Xylaria arbuscula TaxID=114810 RepID=A0A9W8NNE2_9PEZI|nr:hypothetical protein NPX13_g361 [Xylaria arbuscula]
MVTFNVAYTAPVNRAGATPTLTQAQVWEGLKLKVKRAQDFVPVITGCEVLSEETLPTGELQVTREAIFAPVNGNPGRTVKEVCVHYEPCRVVFKQEDGSSVMNLISTRPDGGLLLSYVFEWRHPNVEAGSEKASQLEAAHWEMAKVAVESSLNTIRSMVAEGKIQ